MNYRLLDAARDELDSSAAHYEDRRSGLGADFIREVNTAIQRLIVDPESWEIVESEFRRCPVKRFPYDVVFVPEDDAVIIVAVAHHHRRPGYWRRRR